MSNVKRIRVVLDTNLIFSAALTPQNPPDRIFKSWLEDSFDLLISKEQLEEIRDASQKRKLKNYPLFLNRIAEVIENLEFAAELIKPLSEVDLPLHVRDPKDDYILATVLAGRADYLVTGDEDLLVLNGNSALGDLRIISVKDFLTTLNFPTKNHP